MIEPLAEKGAGESTQRWLSEVAHDTVLAPTRSEQWMFIDGEPALRVVNGTSDSESTENVYVVHGAKTFAIRLSGPHDARSRSVCQQVLSTFRFSIPSQKR
jgi:hypothetical protein